MALATVSSAIADDRPFLEVLAFVYSIDASPYWTARIGNFSIDQETATLTIESLIITAEKGDLAVIIESATLAGYSATDDGGLAAAALEIERATITTAASNAVFSDIRFEDVGAPALAGVAYDKVEPFSSLIGAFSAIAKCRTSGGRIAAVDISQKNQGQTSLITYRNVALGALSDGKLANTSVGPLTLRSPATDPLAEMTIRQAEVRGIDLDAFVHALDPLRYVTGTGDGQWREAIGYAGYTDLTLTAPSIRLSIGEIAMDGIKVRQAAESFAPLLDAMTTTQTLTPPQMRRLNTSYLGKLLSAFGVGRLAIDDIVVTASGIDQLTLAAFELKDSSSDGLGEISAADFVAAITGQGAAQFGRFALSEVVLPSYETFDAALEMARRNGDVDMSSLVPKVGSIEADDIYLRAVDFPGLALDRLRTNFGKYVGTVPTTIALDVENLKLATGSLPSESMRSLIAGLGYEEIDVDANFSINWHEADGTVTLDDFELDIADFGNTRANLVMAGLTRDALEGADDASALDGLVFEKARVTFQDRSVVDRSLSMRADLLNIPLERLKQQLSGALPLMLAVLGDQAKAMVPVLQNFIESPGTLTIEAAPDAPVPVADIKNAVRRPQSLPGLLGISLSGRSPTEATETEPTAPRTPTDHDLGD